MDDPVITYLVEKAREDFHLERVILFGSRARGDHVERSDYDVAFVFPPEENDRWARFALAAEDEVPTLKHIDLLNWNTCTPQLQQRIAEEGRVVYGT